MLQDIDDFRILFPSIVNHASELVNDSVQTGNIQQIRHIEISNGCSDLFDTRYFLLTVFNDRLFSSIDVFLNDGNGDGKMGMIQCQLPIRMDRVVVEFAWSTTKEHKINDQVWINDIIGISS